MCDNIVIVLKSEQNHVQVMQNINIIIKTIVTHFQV